MKKVIRLTESELNDIIKGVLKEQEEDQFMTDQNPEQMAGGINDEGGEEGGEPSFDEFLQCAQALLDQGVTIGNLVDKLLEAEPEEEEPEAEPEAEPTPETMPATDQKLAESKKVRKVK